MDFRLRAGALDDLVDTPEVFAHLDREARKVRDTARRTARTISSKGAERAIVAEPATRDADGVHVDIGYDKNHPGFYLWWVEVGTRFQPAQPHLRPALRGRSAS